MPCAAWPLWPATAICTELVADLGAEAIGAYDIALANRLRDGLGLTDDLCAALRSRLLGPDAPASGA